MKKDIFRTLLLIARPAAGKSEIISYLRHIDDMQREQIYHLGSLDIIDDFEMLWTWFEEDRILEKMGHSRLHTDKDDYFIWNYLWDLLIEKISLEYDKRTRDVMDYCNSYTTIIEFSRGKEHGGYRNALEHLSKKILSNLAIMYVDVSWEESIRKNKKRFNPEKPDSVLEHSLSLEKMERLYKETDWFELTEKDPNFIRIDNVSIPYVIFNNEDDVTSNMDEKFSVRLKNKLDNLWHLYSSKLDPIF